MMILILVAPIDSWAVNRSKLRGGNHGAQAAISGRGRAPDLDDFVDLHGCPVPSNAHSRCSLLEMDA